MSEVRATIDIDAPPDVVFATAMEPASTPDWVTIVLRVEGHDPGALRAGYKMRQRICLRGVPFTVEWTLTDYEAPHFARWEGKGPARSKAITENRLEAKGGGTHFTYTNEFKTPFGPLGKIAAGAIMGGVPEREATASLKALKALVEKGSQ
jgi:uncharacterized protein YndB with AHSA1/START domain